MNYEELIIKTKIQLEKAENQEERNNLFKNLGFYYYQNKNPKNSLEYFLKVEPKDFTTCRSISAIYLHNNQMDQSNNFAELCLRIKFDVNIAYDLALHYTKICSFHKALALYQTLLEMNCNNINIYNNIADIYNCLLQPKKAMEYYLKGFEMDNNRMDIYSNLVMTSYYIYKYDPIKRFNYAKKFEEMTKSSKIFCNDSKRRNNDKIRIGYIGYDFDKLIHPISCFVKHIIENHNPNNFKVYCYQASDKTSSCFQTTDGELYTTKMNNVITRNLSKMDNLESASLIYNDKIDILVELMNHTAGNRLNILSYKPAPIQISYCAFPGTTGLSCIDYKLLDNITFTNRVNTFYTEKTLRMDNGFHCYVPTYTIPSIIHNNNNNINFCCFNNVKKINDKVIETWIHILRLVPQSQLYLRYYHYSSSFIVKFIKNRFEKIAKDLYIYKFDISRIHFIGYEKDYTTVLKMYSSMDIFLDTFPYTGTTVLCEALSVGIPVFTLLGKHPHERIGASLLSSMGRPELIAKTEREYIDKVVFLARNRNNIIAYKKILPIQMKNSLLGNSKIFMKEYEEVLQNVLIN